MLLAKMDEIGRPAWIAATLVAFWLFWPVGLVVLIYLAWTGRLRNLQNNAVGQWFNVRSEAVRRPSKAGASGNPVFDEYRDETLRRLEEEQREFVEYLERLRRARDKSEFDQFMAERRNRTPE